MSAERLSFNYFHCCHFTDFFTLPFYSDGSWAFSAVDALQAALFIALKLDATQHGYGNLSVEQIEECSGIYSNCSAGGNPEDALDFVGANGGLDLTGSFGGSCSEKVSVCFLSHVISCLF